VRTHHIDLLLASRSSVPAAELLLVFENFDDTGSLCTHEA